jgi:hypothetical protein
LKELVWEISTSEKELDTIETGLVDGFSGCIGIPLDISFDFIDRERARDRVGGRHGDTRGSDHIKIRIFGLEQVKVGGTADRPKLEEDV